MNRSTQSGNWHAISIKTLIASITIILIFADAFSAYAEGWLTYRHSITRNGVTSERLLTPLSLQWIFKPAHTPKPAWNPPAEEMKRVHYDDAYYVTSANGLAYFGSSVDNKVYALDIQNGKIRWSYFTEGPVRYVPTLWENKVYFGSDDGNVYCLDAAAGRLIWKYRAGPSDERVLGNGRMISLWPVRTGILVDEGEVFFGAGVFPNEGIYICALNALDGSVIWKNDTDGERAQELDWGGISPQNYLLASENMLYVPSGRAMPAAFNRQTGEFLYYLPAGHAGGAWALLDGGTLIAGVDQSGIPARSTFDKVTGKSIEDIHAWAPGIDLITTPLTSYTLTYDGIFALDRTAYRNLANNELKSIREERARMQSRDTDLRRKSSGADEKVTNEVNKEREKIAEEIMALNKKENNLKCAINKWNYSHKGLNTIILAGTTIFAGGANKILAVDAQTGQELWSAEIDGEIRGLAAANGKLFASADNGYIYCFAEGAIYQTSVVKAGFSSEPYLKDALTPVYVSAVWTIKHEGNISKGYCLILDCGTGRLAYELAIKSDLKIIGIEKDAAKVAEAKRMLDEAGLYGSRVVVEQWDISSLPDYFADLIVSDNMITHGTTGYSSGDIFRVVRPYGGIALFGQPAEASSMIKLSDLKNIFADINQTESVKSKIIESDGAWIKLVRGEIGGAGSWTELYGNPQNTACSEDQLVRSPLGVLWYGEPGPERMIERHSKAMSPVSIDGRLFIQGEEVMMAYNAFNGTHLWTREIPGAVRARADVDGGNISATKNGIYIAAHDKCYRLDPETGATIHVYQLPASSDDNPRRWGYISCINNILYGSQAAPLQEEYFGLLKSLADNRKWRNANDIPEKYRTEFESLKAEYPEPDEKMLWGLKRSGILWRLMTEFPLWENYNPAENSLSTRLMSDDLIFAMDPETGKLLWSYKGDKIAHITISIGDGRIFFAESSVSDEEKKQELREREALIAKGIYEGGKHTDVPLIDTDIRKVISLDAATGKKLWEKTVDFTGCCGDAMGSAYYKGVLLFFGNVGNHDAFRFNQGTLKWKRVTALSTNNGEILWSKANNYRTRPLIVGDKLIIEPRACDPRTGEIIMRTHPITEQQTPWEWLRPGHTCAITGASAHALFYRSYCKGIYDITADNGVSIFGGIRPGCWITMIAANGILLSPEGSSGCTCSFPIKCTMALQHKPKRSQPWNVFVTHGAQTPVKHFAINFGAIADMKDEKGTAWFGYPNPVTIYGGNHYPNYGVKFDLKEKFQEGMGFFCSDFKGKNISGTDKPWLYTSGCLGLTQCEIPLIDDAWGEQPGFYTVRLGFCAPEGDIAGQRIFGIKLQGEHVLNNFDILEEAGIPQRALIKEFRNIAVENKLIVELTSGTPNPSLGQTPIVNFIEIIREDEIADKGTLHKEQGLTKEIAETLLNAAHIARQNDDNDRALELYHTVLDGSPSKELKLKAFEGIASIGSERSLTKLAPYCRDTSPILWNYNEPDDELIAGAARAYIAIAKKKAETNKKTAISMFRFALSLKQKDVHELAVSSLKDMGIEINE